MPDLEPPAPLDAEAAAAIRNFLVGLAEDRDRLVEYVRDPFAALSGADLTDEAKALLLDSNFARVHAVMSKASDPVRWIVSWIV